MLLAKTGQPSSSSAIAENYTLERLCELSAKINWLNDELKNAAGSGIAAYIHATKDLNTGESGLAGKLKSLEDQMFRLSAELKSIKSVGFSKPVDTALEAETNIPITSNSSAQPDLPEESVPVLITPSKTSEVAQTETTDLTHFLVTGALTPLIIRTNPDFLKVQRKLALLSKRQQQFLKLLRLFLRENLHKKFVRENQQ